MDSPKFISFKRIYEGTFDIRILEDVEIRRIYSTEENGVKFSVIVIEEGDYIRTTETIEQICRKLRRVGLIGDLIE